MFLDGWQLFQVVKLDAMQAQKILCIIIIIIVVDFKCSVGVVLLNRSNLPESKPREPLQRPSANFPCQHPALMHEATIQ